MTSKNQRFEISADYFQFCIQDEHASLDSSVQIWSQEQIDNLLATSPGTIHVGTVRNLTVPIEVEVSDGELFENLELWDHVTECSVDIPSGQIVVLGTTDYFPDATRIKVEPGTYRARIFYGGLNTLSVDSLDGDDHYKIVLWPDPKIPPRVLKRWTKQSS